MTAVEPERTPSDRGPCGRRRAALWFALPSVLLLLIAFAPVITGSETLVLRDVLINHLMLKVPQAEAYRAGTIPLVDPTRGGGQPSFGNPNALPLYPTNLLFLLAPPIWALNAHFWLHLLLAPWAAYALGRAWGLGRPASWAGGLCYGLSGFFLAQLNFYNLIAGVTLAPLFVAAVLHLAATRATSRATSRGGARAIAATGMVWALLLLSGDPLIALFAALLAGSAVLARDGRRAWTATVAGALAAAVVLGLLVALPQLFELGRILSSSFRSHGGFDSRTAWIGSFHPLQAVELVVPLFFGRYDLLGAGGFWGFRFFGGDPPFFLSLYPGSLALALAAAAGRPRTRVEWWAWAVIGVGVFLALGRFNPLFAPLLDLSVAKAFRFPVKFWLFVAVGGSLLAALGFERTFPPQGPPRLRPVAWALAVLGLVQVVFAGVVLVPAAGVEGWLGARLAPAFPPSFAAGEMARWLATVTVSLGVLAGLGLGLGLARRRPALGAALVLGVHSAGQLFLLRPICATDAVAPYRTAPPVMAALTPGERLVNGGFVDLFGAAPVDLSRLPDPRRLWQVRISHAEMWPFAAVLFGYRYDMNQSPEGLDSFLARFARELMVKAPDDGQRVRALRHWGLRHLFMPRPLTESARDAVRLVGEYPSITRTVRVYEILGAAPEVGFAEEIVPAEHVAAAWRRLTDPAFDAARTVVLPGVDTVSAPPDAAGSVRVLVDEPERLEVETDSPVPGVVVIQRSHLAIYQAAVDDAPVAVEAANLYRIGLRVPAGHHRVRLWVSRTGLHVNLALSALALAGLAVLAFSRSSRE